MYERTDRVIEYLIKQLLKLFNKLKSLVKGFDEVNLIDYSKTMYEQIDKTSLFYIKNR